MVKGNYCLNLKVEIYVIKKNNWYDFLIYVNVNGFLRWLFNNNIYFKLKIFVLRYFF